MSSVYFALVTVLLFAFNLAGAAIPDSSSHVIHLHDPEKVYEISNRVLLFEDESAQMDLSQIVAADSLFEPGKGEILKFGFTRSAIWCKFTVTSHEDKKWYLDIGNPSTNEADLFILQENGSFEHIKTGNDLEFEQKSLHTNELLLPLNLNAGETKNYYLRVSSNTIVKLPIKISSLGELFENNHRNDVGNGIYFGFILALCLYNIFVFISIRDITYLYYVIYMAFFAANIAFIKGYALEFIAPGYPSWNHGNYYSTIAIIFVVLFTNSFLLTSQFAPRARWISLSIISLCVIDILITLAGMKFEGYILANILAGLSISYVLAMGTYVFLKNFKAALIFLMGFMVISFGIIIHILSNLSVFPTNFFTENGMLIGSAFEATILSYAMANKFRILKKEKEITQQQALNQAMTFSKELIRSQEEERKRIARELHDSIGQNLSVIKNRIFMLNKEKEDAEKLDQSYDSLQHFVGQTIEEVRNISHGLRPYQLDLFGLTQSLKSLIDDVASVDELRITSSIDPIDSLLSKENEINTYRIIQECLNNILKHAEARSVNVSIEKKEKSIRVNIIDDGIGIQPDRVGKGFGMTGMRERINVLNGKLTIQHNQPSGTHIMFEIPVA